MFAFLLATLASSAFASHLDFAKYLPETAPPGYVTPRDTAAPVDWSQPPLGCVEEMVTHQENHPCLDLTQVANPMSDWPANLPLIDKVFWYTHRRGLTFCRTQELMNRENAKPGSQDPVNVQVAWMVLEGAKDFDIKVKAIYDAADQFSVPPHVLTGAFYQESLFAALGISDDGGNFSCGAEQINLHGWCLWANKQTRAERKAMDWPETGIDCSDSTFTDLALVRPFYNIALTRLNGLPEYRLQPSHFANIPQSAVESSWPAAAANTQALRYRVVRSFIDHCSEPRRGILAGANELRSVYESSIPPAFQNKDRYTGGTRFQRQCRRVPKDNSYPLHAGWVMTVGAYNAGTRAIDAIAYYNQWSPRLFNDPTAIKDFTPDQIIDSIYLAGAYNKSTDKMDFIDLTGTPRSWTFYTACVAQREVARVMQQVTLLPEFFVNSLDTAQYPCAKSVIDSNGTVVKTSVPPARQVSSGHK